MRPVKLEIKGFSAFRDETAIDFTDIELLALVGPTGSGKSSVIDAMTFALYGSASRYGERDVAPVINQLSNEARVRFTFEVAGAEYSATRIVRRTKAGASVKEARLERADVVLAAGKEMSGAVTKLLGLDFQRFNKTVVLPQGRFAEFLHDTPKDRQKLLQELFGFGIYEELGRRARDIASTTRNEADVRERSIADLGDLSDEHLGDLEATAAAVAHALASFDALAQQHETADREVAVLEQRIGHLLARRQLLSEIAVPEDVADLSDRLAVARSAEVEAAEARDRARAQLKRAQDAVADGPDLLACQQLIDIYERRQGLEVKARAQREQVEAAEQQLARLRTAAQLAHGEIATAKEATQSARARRDAAAGAVSQAGDRTQLANLVTAHDRLAELSDGLARQQEAVAELEALAEKAEAAAAQARGECDRLERLQPALALATHLHVGDACPVCQHTVERMPDVSGFDDSALREAREVASAAELKSKTADKVAAEARASATSLAKELSKVDQQLVAVADRPMLVAQLAELDRLIEQAEMARQEAGRAEAQLEVIEDDPMRSQTIIDERAADANLSALRAVLQRDEGDLDELGERLAGKPDEATARAGALQAHDLVARARQAQEAEEEAEQQHAACVSRRGEAEQAERAARQDYDDSRESVAELKPPKPAGSLAADWASLVAWCESEVATHQDGLRVLDGQVAAALAARSALMASIDELVEGLVDDPMEPLADVRAELIRAESAAKHDVDLLSHNRRRAAKVTVEVAALRADAAVADELGKLLRADGFPRWLLEEAMNDLVNRATVRLRELTAEQYSLVADDGAFKIVDHRNADEVRDARSLSGGETFLTSLSLALALADSTVELAAEGAAPMESIFLDEGFGTLDPDTLDVVAGTIEELGASGRMVGIVTHIRDLAERMPTRLEISKGPNGSVVRRVDV